VIHLAAEVGIGQSMYEITRYVAANAGGTALLWEILSRDPGLVERVIVASSMSIYGEGAYLCAEHGTVFPPARSDAQLRAQEWELACPECGRRATPVATSESKLPAPASTYAITKRDQEELSLVLGRAYAIPTVALRFFNVYGSRQALSNPYTGALANLSARLLTGRAPIIYEDGRQTRDLVHVSDVVQALVLALETPRGDYRAFNVGTGTATSIGELAAAVSRELGVEIEPERQGHFRSGDIRHCYADISALCETFGYLPRVALEAGIREWLNWARTEMVEDRVEQAQAELLARNLII
jgi:dTDP-L-rhamnose 4-epimerase